MKFIFLIPWSCTEKIDKRNMENFTLFYDEGVDWMLFNLVSSKYILEFKLHMDDQICWDIMNKFSTRSYEKSGDYYYPVKIFGTIGKRPVKGEELKSPGYLVDYESNLKWLNDILLTSINGVEDKNDPDDAGPGLDHYGVKIYEFKGFENDRKIFPEPKEIKVEEPKVEEIKVEEPKVEEIKVEPEKIKDDWSNSDPGPILPPRGHDTTNLEHEKSDSSSESEEIPKKVTKRKVPVSRKKRAMKKRPLNKGEPVGVLQTGPRGGQFFIKKENGKNVKVYVKN